MATTTKIDLVTQVFNILRPVNGGTGLNDFPNPVGNAGFLYSDGTNIIKWRSTAMNDALLQQILTELQAMKNALVALACDGGRAQPQDFEPGKVKLGEVQ